MRLGTRMRGPAVVVVLFCAVLVLGAVLVQFRSMHDEIRRLRLAVTASGISSSNEMPVHSSTEEDDVDFAALSQYVKALDCSGSSGNRPAHAGSTGMREILDSAAVYQNGPSMIYVYSDFLNGSEVAHSIEIGSKSVAKIPWAKGRPDAGHYRSSNLDINRYRGDAQLALMHERVARLVRIPLDLDVPVRRILLSSS